MSITVALILILVLFIVALVVRRLTGLSICALCTGVSGTWLILLCLYLLTGYGQPLVIGVLMGGSAVGAIYYGAARLPERFEIFKLPVLLTFFVAVVLVLAPGSIAYGYAGATLGVVWLAFGGLYAIRRYPAVKSMAHHVIDCCRNW